MSSTAGSVHHIAEEPRRWIDEWGPVAIFGGIPYMAAFIQAWSFTSLRKFQADPFSIVIGLASVFTLCLVANMALGRRSIWAVSVLAGTFILAVSVMLFVPNWSHPNAIVLALIGLFGGALALNGRHTGWNWTKRALAIIGGDAEDEVDEALLMRLRELDDADRNNGAGQRIEWAAPTDDQVIETTGGSRFSPQQMPESGVGFNPTEYVFPRQAENQEEQESNVPSAETSADVESTRVKRIIFGAGADQVEVEPISEVVETVDSVEEVQIQTAELVGPLNPNIVPDYSLEGQSFDVPSAPELEVVLGTEAPIASESPAVHSEEPSVVFEEPNGFDVDADVEPEALTNQVELSTPTTAPEIPAIFSRPNLVSESTADEVESTLSTESNVEVTEDVISDDFVEPDDEDAGKSSYDDDEISRLREALRKARLS